MEVSQGYIVNAEDNVLKLISEERITPPVGNICNRELQNDCDNRNKAPANGSGDAKASTPAPVNPNTEGVNLSGISGIVFEIVSVLCFILLSSCILQFLISKIYDKIPISLVLFIFGMIVYGIIMAIGPQEVQGPFLQSLTRVRKIDNSVLYYIALPILLYEATQTINWYAFCNFLMGGIALAVGGVIMQVIILGLLFRFTLGDDTHWSYTKSFLLASILSSTDPVAVLSVLGDVRAPTKIISMFNGESLINDGTSVLMFQFFYMLSIGRSESYSYYSLLFTKLLVLSPLLGVLVAFIVIIWVSFFRRYHMAQCISVVGTSYLVFFISEYYLNLSGPLCIVCYGVYIKAYGLVAFDREALEKHHSFVEGFSSIANSAVFLISGMLTIGMLESQFMLRNVWVKIFKLLMVYLFLNIARSIMIISFSPLLSYIGYRINLKEIILLIWGGLRGAMVLVLGLRLESDPRIDDGTSDILAFYIGGSTMLILLLQGFTFDCLYRCLNPYPMKPFRRVYLEKTMQMIEFKYISEIQALGYHWLFKGTSVIQYANRLVPSLSNVRWNKIGKLVFNNIKVDVSYELPATPINAEKSFENPMDLPLRCATVISAESDYSEDMQELDEFSDDNDENIFLFANGALQRKNSDLGDYDPKLYLRLLEHATIAESQNPDSGKYLDSRSNSEHTIASIESSKLSSFHLGSQMRPFALPQRMDTDATINLENLYLDQYSRIRDYDNECPSSKGKKVLRMEREGELYIMIFNAFSHLYNEMYHSGFIDGRSLLSLQSSLDIAADFAIKRLKQRSIAVWKDVLSEYIQDPSNCDFPESVDEMDGFAFEWFVLHSIISGSYTKSQVHISSKHRVISTLEILVAYVDVHQRLLERGGKSLERLLDSTLLESYKKQIVYAKSYVKAIKAKWPNSFSAGLLNKAACMMIRIKKEIVDEQCANGLLLDEDRRQIQEMLDDQLHKITTKIDYVSLVKQAVRRFLKYFYYKGKRGNDPL